MCSKKSQTEEVCDNLTQRINDQMRTMCLENIFLFKYLGCVDFTLLRRPLNRWVTSELEGCGFVIGTYTRVHVSTVPLLHH